MSLDVDSSAFYNNAPVSPLVRAGLRPALNPTTPQATEGTPIFTPSLLLALEGGGTRSQAVLLDPHGQVLASRESQAVNTNFVPIEQARQALLDLVTAALRDAGVQGSDVAHFTTSLVAANFGPETFAGLCPKAEFHTYPEMRVVFARAGIYCPHGVSLVAATGATVWGVRSDDGREAVLGGWGSLLGDEGSAYAIGLQGLRAAVRSFEGRAAPSALVATVREHFNVPQDDFREGLIRVVYQQPLSRTDIAAFAPAVTRLAAAGDALAAGIVAKAAGDLAALVLSAAGQLFTPQESFDVVMAGGLVNAGDLILAPLRARLAQAYPLLNFQTGSQAPAIALARLTLYELENKPC